MFLGNMGPNLTGEKKAPRSEIVVTLSGSNKWSRTPMGCGPGTHIYIIFYLGQNNPIVIF
jgi:hypothetical protein